VCPGATANPRRQPEKDIGSITNRPSLALYSGGIVVATWNIIESAIADCVVAYQSFGHRHRVESELQTQHVEEYFSQFFLRWFNQPLPWKA